jgi:hypothetical protein
MFCVFNLKEESLAFPYLDTDPRVCYISGSNPTVIDSVIRSLAVAIKDNVQINPTMILHESLNKFDTSMLCLNVAFTDDSSSHHYMELYSAMGRNVPKKSTPKPLSDHLEAKWKPATLISDTESDTDTDTDSDVD